jgi:hypothetical protein
MAVDRYTKLVLTVIAVCLVCLVWLSAGGPSLITPVSAQTNQRVLIAGWVDESGAVFSFPKAPSRLDCTSSPRRLGQHIELSKQWLYRATASLHFSSRRRRVSLQPMSA